MNWITKRNGKTIEEGIPDWIELEPITNGYGYYGVVLCDPATGKLQCSICGDFFNSLGAHLSMGHGIKPTEYKDDFGIPLTIPLCAIDISRKLTEARERYYLKPDNLQKQKDHLRRLAAKLSYNDRVQMGRASASREDPMIKANYRRIGKRSVQHQENLNLAYKKRGRAKKLRYEQAYLEFIKLFEQGVSTNELTGHFGCVKESCYPILARLLKKGKITRLKTGRKYVYQVAGEEEEE